MPGRPLALGVRKRHSPAANLGPGWQDQAPWQEPGEATGATGAGDGDFARGSLGAQAPTLARGVPTPSLDPRRTPASCDKRPSASTGLGHKGPWGEQRAYVAANPQTPPSRPHHCEDPPVLPSVKGSPFTDGRTGGSPPGDGFCPSRGWLVSGPDAGLRMRRQAPPPQASLRATGPTLETSGQVHRIPGVVSGETEAFPATQRTARFPVDHTSQHLCHPCRGRVPREDLRTWGLGGGPAKVPRQVERAWAGRTIALGPVLLWCLRPGPSPGG